MLIVEYTIPLYSSPYVHIYSDVGIFVNFVKFRITPKFLQFLFFFLKKISGILEILTLIR
jgi:hypothetical protein